MDNHSEIREKIEATLDTIRPYLELDGGNIEVVDITEDMLIRVRLLGNCESCPMSFMTMKASVEETLKRMIPGLKGVEAINVRNNY